MARERLYLFDTTLRDGAQTNGVDFTLNDKLTITGLLDDLGIDCVHFFDGYKANPEFALACAKAAYEEGARWVVLCDTNGGTLPHEVEAIVTEVCKVIPGDHVGIHAHNDTEQAVANSLAAVRAGARQIQGTLNGLGERCGNANLCSLIPTLRLKPEFSEKFDISVSDDKLKQLAHASRTLDEMLNRAPN